VQIVFPTAPAACITDSSCLRSGSERGIEQTYDDADNEYLKNSRGASTMSEAFYERYFEGKVWMNNARDIYTKLETGYVQGRQTRWAKIAVQHLQTHKDGLLEAKHKLVVEGRRYGILYEMGLRSECRRDFIFV
jgi:hypothetical protein